MVYMADIRGAAYAVCGVWLCAAAVRARRVRCVVVRGGRARVAARLGRRIAAANNLAITK